MLTKAQIAKLPTEQQEALAQIELSNARKRQQLLDEVRGLNQRSRFIPFVAIAYGVALFTFLYFAPSDKLKIFALYILAAALLIYCIVQAFTARINRRLDALLELMEMERKLQNEREDSKEEK